LATRTTASVTSYKAREKQLLSAVTPRLTKGLLAMAKARARLELRTEATLQDVQACFVIVEGTFPAYKSEKTEKKR
jgi:DNA replicative helicase MCM subunit Mcm2 (Cdc46/Mcm family)